MDTKNNTADLFTKHLDGLRTQSLAEKLGLRILDGTSGTNGTKRLRAFEQAPPAIGEDESEIIEETRDNDEEL